MSWSEQEHNAVVKSLAIACEITGTVLSDAAQRFILEELSGMNAGAVLGGLRRCARECKGRLALADVLKAVEHIDRKQISDERASRDVFLTQLRGLALVESIEWDARHPEAVQAKLEAKGYRFQAVTKPVRQLPHWTEDSE